MDKIRYIYRYTRNTIIRTLALLWGKNIKSPQNMVIISPHPDDEALGCGGLISQLKKNGCEVTVIILTGGENCSSTKDLESNHIKEVRRNLTRKACAVLGVSENDLYFLDFIDGSVNNKDSEMKKLQEIIKRTNSKAVFIPHLEDGWNDHVQAHKIVKDLLKGTSIELYAYCVWFWYTMPFKRVLSLKWKTVCYLTMDKNDNKAKSEAIAIYMRAKSPEGIFYSGQLPKILIKSCLWKHEIYFRINN
jgi:LmbE family N-acetylglucosaminyl deacetylase